MNTLMSELCEGSAAADWPLFFLLQRKSDSSCREGTKSLCRQADIFVLFSFSVDLYFILIQLLAQGHQFFLCVLNALNIFPAQGSIRCIFH